MKAADLLDRPLRLVRRFFIDPLSVKELSGIARRWQLYIGRGVYISLIGFIVWIFWTSVTRRGDWMSPSSYANLGRELFYSFFALQMVVVTLGGISAASDMITRELRGGTLGLLALTPLTPWRIVAGKWKAALIQTSTVLLCGAPVFGVCVYLGGVGLRELSYSLTLSLVSASLGAAVGLLCSTLFRAGYVATIVSLIAVVIYCVVPLIPLISSHGDEEFMTFLCWTHPLFAAVGAAMPAGMGIGTMWARGWICASLVTAGLIYLLLRGCTSRVRLLIRRPGGEAPETPTLEGLRGAPAVAGPGTSAAARFFRGQGRVWETNAILWKELSTRRIGAGKSARLGVALLVFLQLTTMGAEGWWRVLVLWFSWIILLLVALANGVSLFVTEREERKWDILLSTPLNAHEIVRAKLVAGMVAMAPLTLLLAAFWALMGLAYDLSLTGVFMCLVSLLLALLLTYLLGAFASLNSRTQRAAFTTGFGVLIGVLAVLPIVAGMLDGFDVLPGGGDYAEFIIGCTNPGTYLAHASDTLSRSYRWDGWQEHRIEQERALRPMFQTYAGLYCTLIVGLVVWMIHRFDRATGRS